MLQRLNHAFSWKKIEEQIELKTIQYHLWKFKEMQLKVKMKEK